MANYNRVASIIRGFHLLFQDFHSDHFDTGIADIDNLEFIVADNDAVLQAGNSAMLIDDIAGKRLRFAGRQFQLVFFIEVIQLETAGEDKFVVG